MVPDRALRPPLRASRRKPREIAERLAEELVEGAWGAQGGGGGRRYVNVFLDRASLRARLSDSLADPRAAVRLALGT